MIGFCRSEVATMNTFYLILFLALAGNRGAEELGEEGVRGQGTRLELWMKLRPKHEWVRGAREFCYLHQDAVGAGTREDKSGIFKLPHVRGIDFLAVAVALFHPLLLICGARRGAFL